MASQTVLPYTSHQSLGQEIIQKWAEISREANPKLKLMPPKKEAERAFALYTNAMSPYLPAIILGGEDLREDTTLIENLGTLSTDPQTNQKTMKAFFQGLGLKPGRTLNDLCIAHLTQGSVLNEANWWILPNDMAMLGGIHGGKEFHLGYTGMRGVDNGHPPEDLLWDKKHNRPRALGRELMMLCYSGYQPAYVKILKKTGIVFIPPEQPVRLSLLQMRNRLKNVTRNDIYRYLSTRQPLQITRPARVLVEAAVRTESPHSIPSAASTTDGSARTDSPPSDIHSTGSLNSERTDSPPSRLDSDFADDLFHNLDSHARDDELLDSSGYENKE